MQHLKESHCSPVCFRSMWILWFFEKWRYVCPATDMEMYFTEITLVFRGYNPATWEKKACGAKAKTNWAAHVKKKNHS